jgi:hypothetical protein
MNKTIYLIVFVLNVILLNAQEMNYYWAHQYGHDSYANDIQSVTSDNLNNIVCFTHFNTSFTIDGVPHNAVDGDDLLVYVVNEDGQVEWSLSDGGEGNQIAQEVVCDNEANIYLMGKFSGNLSFENETFESNGSFDMYLIKLDAFGNLQWVKTFGGPNSESFESINIHNNKINIVGRYYEYTLIQNDTIWGVDGTDFFVSQFDLDGNLLQYVTFGGESVDYVSDVAADNMGNIYIAGDFYQNLQIGDDLLEAGDMLGIYLMKLNSNLDIIWYLQPNGSDLKPGVKISCDSEGNIALAGNFSGNVSFENTQLNTADFDEDIYVAYFSPDGELSWAKRFYSSSMESVKSFEMDRIGDVYIAGHYLNHIHFNDLVITYNLCCGDPEIFFVKLNETGEVLNHSQLTGERSSLQDMYVPEVNQVILAGQFSEHFQMGEIELNSPTSYNVFLAYYKDDTWLNTAEETIPLEFIHNTISSNSFILNNLNTVSEIRVYSSNGNLMEQISLDHTTISIGQNWSTGFYMLQLISTDSKPIGLKVLKI